MLGIIKRTCTNECDQRTLILLYKSLFRSQLEYASQVWSPYIKGKITALERTQRHATKFILKTDLSYPERLVKLKGKLSAQPHTTLCIQFLDRENKLTFGLNVITNGNNFSVSFPRVLSKSSLGMAEALEN